MQNENQVLSRILENNSRIDRSAVKKVLLLYEERIMFIGDCCVRVNKLRFVRRFLNDAALHMNFNDQGNFELTEALLKNNPYIESVTLLDWAAIRFEEYDIVFCIAYNEQRLLEYLCAHYGAGLLAGTIGLAVYSLSELLLVPRLDARVLFPCWPELIADITAPKPGELYVSAEERDDADDWLLSHGLCAGEELFVFCDSSADRSKLLRNDVYFDLLAELLKRERIKILIFDERNLGKEAFYRRWLGSSSLGKIIVSKGMSLRHNLCLIASRYTRFVMGPCTGVMHCASSIYNYYVSKRPEPEKAPVMIAYTGIYTKANKNANFWWGSSPLIDCLLLKEDKGRPGLVVLHELPADQRDYEDTLPCSFYTKEMLLDYINGRLAIS